MPNLNTRTSSVQKPSIFDQFRQHVAEIVADPALTSSTRRFTRQSAKQKASTNESTATMPTKSFIAETSMTTRGNEQSEIETLRAENLELKSQLARTNKELLKLKDQFRAKNTKLQRFNNIKSSMSEKFHSWQKKLDNHLKEFNKPNTSTEVLPIQANNIASAFITRRNRVMKHRKLFLNSYSIFNFNLIFDFIFLRNFQVVK